MIQNLINTLGESNPQLFRELKGRFKPINILLVSAISFLLQLIVFLYQLQDIPNDKYPLSGDYCSIKPKPQEYSHDSCPLGAINWQLWWRDHWENLFLSFSVIFVFALLIAGTYLLINDLGREERRGTLNFIRLSPQPEKTILIGKLLGVPSLIYLFVLTAIPLHLWAGHAAKIAGINILSYYLTLLASCYFFYSLAILFALGSRWFSNFQPWLGSGTALLFLWMTMMFASSSHYSSDNYNDPLTWLRLMAPWEMINYLFPNLFTRYEYGLHGLSQLPITHLEFWSFPIGKSLPSLLGFHLLNYLICAYGIWQVIKRSFRHGNITMLSKRQSYFLVAFCQLMFIGFSLSSTSYPETITYQMILNTAISLILIFALSPHRSIIQDWARYRHQDQNRKSLVRDLIYGEKSPAGLAIAINLVIAWTPLIIWTLFLPENLGDSYSLTKSQSLLAVTLAAILIMIYASITQLILLAKNSKRYVWSISALAFLMFLPTVIPVFLDQYHYSTLSDTAWLFSAFPWMGVKHSASTTIYLTMLSEFTITVLLNFQLNRQLKRLGESSTKELLVG